MPMPEKVTVAGSPAKVRESINDYQHKTLDEKFEVLNDWIKDFCKDSKQAFTFKN
jgi:alkanesulfonate monooxygenase SsuD/methylene tetrahydromethanopterin reductase-like flavin-dependent oxidoreductase (luciferase family)